MERVEIQEKNILIMGAGKSGVSACEFVLDKNPAKVVLSDSKPMSKLEASALELGKKGVVIETEGHKDSSVVESDIIVVSPGVPLSGSWYETAKRNDKYMIGEIELAYQYDKSKVIAITGTNGKTTATMLTYDILKDQLKDKVVMAGNIGTPYCEIVRHNKGYEYVVLEVSSFQLETIKSFKPFIASILNITDDHLDRYASMQEYAEAKANIFKYQDEKDFLILNNDDKFTGIMTSMAKGPEKIYFSAYEELKQGYFIKNNAFMKIENGKEKMLFGLEGMNLIGRHNYANALACIITADIMGLDMAKTEETVKRFKPAAHRIEFVAEVAGKKFYDDSKGTNIDAVIKAVDTFNEDLALILGGREKNTDFTQLYSVLPKYVKKIIVFGENKEKLKDVFEKGYEVISADTMEEVVKKATALSGIKIVLLSPGCASFDMYKSYAQRGDEFKKYVLKAMKNEK